MFDKLENQVYKNKKGTLEIICGSMFSGKTEELIRRIRRAQFAHLQIKIFKPAIDTRYSKVDVISHDRTSIPCIPINSPKSILAQVDDVDVVGLDETQFFDSSIVEVCEELVQKGIRVIAAGLDMDFKGRPFGSMPNLMAIAHDVYKVHAICVKCGSLAYISHRLVSSDKKVLLGETEIYEPLCLNCYNKAVSLEERDPK